MGEEKIDVVAVEAVTALDVFAASVETGSETVELRLNLCTSFIQEVQSISANMKRMISTQTLRSVAYVDQHATIYRSRFAARKIIWQVKSEHPKIRGMRPNVLCLVNKTLNPVTPSHRKT